MPVDPTIEEFVSLAAGPDVSQSEVDRLAQWAQKGVLSMRKSSSSTSSADMVLDEFARLHEATPELLAELAASLARWPRLNRKAEVLRLLVHLSASAAAREYTPSLSLPAVHTPTVSTAVPAAMPAGCEEPAPLGEGGSRLEAARQLSFLFQGTESEWVRFSASGEARLTRTGEEALTANEQRLFLRISELGGLYHSIRTSLASDPWNADFSAAVAELLKEVQGLAVVLESVGDSGWSLHKIHAWSFLLTNKVRAVRDFLWRAKQEEAWRGGRLISLIYPLTKPGVAAQDLFAQLLAVLLRTLLANIETWVSEGRLPSVGGFFISAECAVDWAQVPDALISRGTAEQVLSCGLSVRFLRHACGEELWLHTLYDPHTRYDPHTLYEGVVVQGEGMVVQSDIMTVTSFKEGVSMLVARSDKDKASVVRVVKEKYKLEEVLRDLHDFVVVGRGDFAQAVADVGGQVLVRGADSIRRHELVDVLDQALRMVGEEGGRVHLVRADNTYAGDVGWDVFGLEVEMEKPIAELVTETMVRKLKRVGSLVWKFVHAEISLTEHWREKRWNVGLHEVWHVIHNLRAFLSYEVLGNQWLLLTDSLKSAKDLDSIKIAINRWTDAMLEGCFLMSDHLGVLDVVHELLDLVKVMNEAQFPDVVRKLVALLETPKPPGKILVFDDLHAGLLAKLNFNDFFRRTSTN